MDQVARPVLGYAVSSLNDDSSLTLLAQDTDDEKDDETDNAGLDVTLPLTADELV